LEFLRKPRQRNGKGAKAASEISWLNFIFCDPLRGRIDPNMTSTADIVIIGGGIHGASLAFHLAQRRAGKVVLIEKKALASGPTAKSGALIRPLFNEAEYIQLVLASTRMFEQWPEWVGGDPGFVQNGFLRIAHSLDPADLDADLELMRHYQVPVEILTVEQLREMVPTSKFMGNEVGVLLPKGGFADPYQTALCLARGARRLGVEIQEGISVLGLDSKEGAWTVRTDAGSISTRLVVNCAGAWSDRVAAMAGLSLPIVIHRVPSFIFRRPEMMAVAGPILSDGVNRIVLRSLDQKHLRAGHFGSEPDIANPDQWDETVTGEQLTEMGSALNRRCDPMRTTASFGGFSALYDMSPDGHPIFGQSQAEGFWCSCGWSGNGFAPAPAAGLMLAQMILAGKSEIDLSMFEWPRRPGVRIRKRDR